MPLKIALQYAFDDVISGEELTALAPGSHCLSIREAKEMLREADTIISRHDGIHRLHGVRACLKIIVEGASAEAMLTPKESEKAQWAIAMMRYVSRRGFPPPNDWRPARSTPSRQVVS